MFKINASDGSLIWRVSTSDFSWDNSITSDNDGRIFLALYADNTINAYDEYDGSLIWSYDLHGRSLSLMLIMMVLFLSLILEVMFMLWMHLLVI
jgi:hypothetical protein